MAEKLKLEVSDEIAIKIQGMNKWFGSFHVLRDIDLTVNRGERIVVCGPSGSGKSTLIRCINALEDHQSGQIIVDGTELTSDIKNIDRINAIDKAKYKTIFMEIANTFPVHKRIDALELDFLLITH